MLRVVLRNSESGRTGPGRPVSVEARLAAPLSFWVVQDEETRINLLCTQSETVTGAPDQEAYPSGTNLTPPAARC